MCREKPDVVILQETKKEVINWALIGAVWGVRFKDWAYLPSVGKSGGILIIWDVRVVRATECITGSFSLSIHLSPLQGESWWLSGIYGPCRYREREEFWEELAGLYGFCGDRWCLGGDFNIVRFPYEKLGVAGRGRLSKSMKDFNTFINETGLRDLNLTNAEFTWSNGRSSSRLDRFLFSLGWEDMFHSVRQEALIRVVSDHFPIIVNTNPFKWGPSPFRFENMWLSHRVCGLFQNLVGRM